jgi:hypothetical protein
MKILEFYFALTPAQLKKLREFLDSDYFNNDKTLPALHDYLCLYKQQQEDLDSESIDLEEIHRTIYQADKPNAGFVRVKLSRMLKLIARFVDIEFCTLPIHNRIEVLNKLNLRKNYEYHIHQVFEEEQPDYKNNLYFLSKSMVYDDYNKYLFPSIGDNIELYKQNIQQFNYHFDAFFILHKLRTLCISLNDKKILNFNMEDTFTEELLGIIKSDKYNEIIPIKLYKYLYRLLNDEESYYEDYLQLIKDNIDHFSYDDIIVFFTYANNYCIKKINESKTVYFTKMFELIQFRIDNQILLVQDEIQPRSFKNIVNTGIRVGATDWVYQFIQTYSKYLPKQEYDKAYHFNMAFYQFEMKQYSKTIAHLSKVEYDDLFYGFNVRLLLLKSYFELREFETLEHLLKSFKTFINRKKGINELYKKGHLNLIQLVHKLTNTHPRDKKKLGILKLSIEQIRPLAEIAWINEKIDVLLK